MRLHQQEHLKPTLNQLGNLLQQMRRANEALEPQAAGEPASPSGAATAVVPLPAQAQPESSQEVTSY